MKIRIIKQFLPAALAVIMLMQPQPIQAIEAKAAALETASIETVSEGQREAVFESDSWENPYTTYNGEEGALVISKSSAVPAAVESAGSLFGLKDIIYDNMLNRNASFAINYTGDTSNLKPDLQSIMAEIDAQDEYLSNSRGWYSWSATGYVNDATITFNVDYLHSKSDEDYIESETDSILSEIISPGMSDLEKVKAVNDYIVLNTQYSEETFASAHSPYAILTEGKGVCQAYALLEYKMLGKLGFERRYVVGNAGGVGHAWNSVNIGGNWYFIDSTWNDPLPDRKYNVSYKYFLVTQEYLDDDHSWEKSNYQQTGGDDYSYFHDMSYTFSDSDHIYYSSDLDGGALHSISVDGSGDIKLNNYKSYYMACYGDWIYYSNYSNGGYIYKIKKDGTVEEKLNTVHSTDLHMDGSRLAYTNNSTGLQEYIQLEEEPGKDAREELEIDPSYSWEEPFSQKTGQPEGKYWTVEFTKPLDEGSVNGENVFVGESDGGVLLKTDTSVTLAEGSKVEIKPVDGWESGGVYYLFISEGVRSENGESLGRGIRMKFTIE
ncbi:protein of unknown function [Peptoclostridium litorale DSM 5388]|uniref:S-layer protein n=1 Tax=Peptoclostridium litorale DSM 5388 TaxID=1121324 RepID=A0A069RCY7_PEPLI|nr:transglutaminase domain-containing protein [Peptoclostridium litorale]KDR94934.1 S-layer protein [Peptoclostridium litorale DSM 5388]SIO34113.1 protein of unknown function [Peptoclostridium litorale DSM 5388]